jgi:PleD family two-component response regulator
MHSNSGEVLLNMADLALYQSKAQGRNRTTIYSSGMEK